MKNIYIFDIDGCVMPVIFENFNSGEPRKKVISDAIKNGNKASLYPEFIEFYKKLSREAESIYFLTGRKYKEFGKITENQLQILNDFRDFQIIYYPERKSYKSHQYFAWKVKEIKKIIKNSIKRAKSQGNLDGALKFNIFDDMSDHFTDIKKIKEISNHQIQLTVIKSKSNWGHLNL
ncbi:MAG: hypothetical protein ACFFE5_02015 [Candidatus Thorarchaeota archaeon]